MPLPALPNDVFSLSACGSGSRGELFGLACKRGPCFECLIHLWEGIKQICNTVNGCAFASIRDWRNSISIRFEKRIPRRP